MQISWKFFYLCKIAHICIHWVKMSTFLACPQHLEIHILTPNYRPINTSKTATLLFTVDILFSKARLLRQRLFADSRLWTADHTAQVPLNNCVGCKSAFQFKTKANCESTNWFISQWSKHCHNFTASVERCHLWRLDKLKLVSHPSLPRKSDHGEDHQWGEVFNKKLKKPVVGFCSPLLFCNKRVDQKRLLLIPTIKCDSWKQGWRFENGGTGSSSILSISISSICQLDYQSSLRCSVPKTSLPISVLMIEIPT